MKTQTVVAAMCVIMGLAIAVEAADFDRAWTHAGPTSVVLTWHLGKIEDAALSYVEYGPTQQLGQKTAVTGEPRWMQFHRITGLETGKPVFYRMVNVDPATKKETKSEVASLTPKSPEGAVTVGEDGRTPIVIDRPGTYVLAKDIAAAGSAIEIKTGGVTLDLDGRTVIFGDDTDKQVFGIYVDREAAEKVAVANGHVVQGRRSGKYSAAVRTHRRSNPLEVSGISTDVHLPCTYPMNLFGGAADADVHHNLLYSRVTELESRHYPGNHVLRVDVGGSNVRLHDNLLTEGCHWAIGLSGEGGNLVVDYNDIRHHQQYVNGYAFGANVAGADIHHNRLTSTGRAVHLTNDGIRFHDNWMDTCGHQQLDDIPAKSRPFKHHSVELHGIKFEGAKSKNCKVYNNFMRITQKQSVDSQGAGDPADKMRNGVYIRGKATGGGAGRLVDDTRSWEKDRWQNYWVKFSPDRPAVLIKGNDATSLAADVEGVNPGDEYVIYQKWTYTAATPLNIACYDPNAMNEVYNNTIVALTTFTEAQRRGGYGVRGQWASSIYFVGMEKGPADAGRHSISIHDNTFISNDLFASSGSGRGVNMTILVNNNVFKLATDPKPTNDHQPFRGLGPVESSFKDHGNKYEGMKP